MPFEGILAPACRPDVKYSNLSGDVLASLRSRISPESGGWKANRPIHPIRIGDEGPKIER
jgi:hypothetical protein